MGILLSTFKQLTFVPLNNVHNLFTLIPWKNDTSVTKRFLAGSNISVSLGASRKSKVAMYWQKIRTSRGATVAPVGWPVLGFSLSGQAKGTTEA